MPKKNKDALPNFKDQLRKFSPSTKWPKKYLSRGGLNLIRLYRTPEKIRVIRSSIEDRERTQAVQWLYENSDLARKNNVLADYYYLKNQAAIQKQFSGDLSDFVKSDKLDSTRDYKRIFHSIAYQLCTAIEFLHSHNIAHQDIKLDNILYLMKNEDIQIALADLDGCSYFDANGVLLNGEQLQYTEVYYLGNESLVKNDIYAAYLTLLELYFKSPIHEAIKNYFPEFPCAAVYSWIVNERERWVDGKYSELSVDRDVKKFFDAFKQGDLSEAKQLAKNHLKSQTPSIKKNRSYFFCEHTSNYPKYLDIYTNRTKNFLIGAIVLYQSINNNNISFKTLLNYYKSFCLAFKYVEDKPNNSKSLVDMCRTLKNSVKTSLINKFDDQMYLDTFNDIELNMDDGGEQNKI